MTRGKRIYVLDTNVLMHDPTCLFRFEEHDVYLPMMTLEELDDHKKGMSEVARNARQVSRTLDALIADIDDDTIEAGIELAKLGNKDAKGRLFFQTRLQNGPTLPEGLPVGKADNQILGGGLRVTTTFDRRLQSAAVDAVPTTCPRSLRALATASGPPKVPRSRTAVPS